MAERPYPLQLVEFIDNNGVVYEYNEALENRSGGFQSRADATACGFTIGLSGVGIISLALLMMGVMASFVPAIVIAILAGVGCSFLMNRWYKKVIQKILDNPEKLYRYRLSRAVAAYNKQAEAYNKYLLVGEENMTPEVRQKMSYFWTWLDWRRNRLQKKIGVDTNIVPPELDTCEIWRTMRELQETEERLALPAALSPAPQTEPPAPVEPSDYMKALVALDEEFTADKD